MSLSDPRVIATLNRHFVPVYLANEDFREGGVAPAAERAELARIRREGLAAGLSVGTVHAYILAPDGRLVDSMHVAQASQPERLLPMLEGAVRRLGTPAGAPVVAPGSAEATVAPAPPPGGLRLRVVARYLQRRGEEYALVETASGDWSALPGIDWVLLEPAAVAALLPAGEAADWAPGRRWRIEPSVAERLLTRFYPPTENNDLSKNRFEALSLEGVLLSAANDAGGPVWTARLEGAFRMRHPFYHREDEKRVEATLVGYLEFDAARRVRSLKLVTDEARYGAPGERPMPFGAALESR